MEIIILAVTDKHEETDNVRDCCRDIVSLNAVRADLDSGTLNVRAGEGFLPKYRFWYQVRGPVAWGSGAAPRGSFS